MSHQITTIPVGERFRVALHADVDAENPRTLGDYHITGAYTCIDRHNTIDVEPVHTDIDGTEVSRAHEVFDSRTDYRAAPGSAIVVRWARIFHQVTVDFNDGTLWWAAPHRMAENWPELVRGTPEYIEQERKVIEAEQREYQMWADGNVYGITVEERVDWARIDGNGEMVFLTEPNTMSTWDDVDALWGIYFDDDYPSNDEVLKYAASELDAGDEFRAAFSALNQISQEASA